MRTNRGSTEITLKLNCSKTQFLRKSITSEFKFQRHKIPNKSFRFSKVRIFLDSECQRVKDYFSVRLSSLNIIWLQHNLPYFKYFITQSTRILKKATFFIILYAWMMMAALFCLSRNVSFIKRLIVDLWDVHNIHERLKLSHLFWNPMPHAYESVWPYIFRNSFFISQAFDFYCEHWSSLQS